MTISNFKKTVLKHKEKEDLESKSITIEANHFSFEPFELKGIVSIYEYIYDQDKGWKKVNKETLPDYLNNSISFFSTVKEKIVRHLESYDNIYSSQSRDWDNIKSEITFLKNDEYYIFPFDVPETKFLLQLHKNFPNSIQYAVQFLANEDVNYRYFNQNKLVGILQAYEFKQQDNAFVSRRNSEKKSLSQIRNAYNKYLNDARTELDGFINKTIEEKKARFDDWYSNTKEDFELFNETSKQAIIDNEAIYKEKLKLEAPAKYWNDRAVKLKGEGKKWLIGLIACSVIAIISLGAVLYFISDGTIKDLFSTSASAIRWSVVFITFVSFLAFAIRIFSKLTFSSYHLVRDAEEREQLAYVYLALKKEGNIDPTEQHLIMQSLFSRADSGLLKDEASPTMPGGSMIEKLMGSK